MKYILFFQEKKGREKTPIFKIFIVHNRIFFLSSPGHGTTQFFLKENSPLLTNTLMFLYVVWPFLFFSTYMWGSVCVCVCVEVRGGGIFFISLHTFRIGPRYFMKDDTQSDQNCRFFFVVSPQIFRKKIFVLLYYAVRGF